MRIHLKLVSEGNDQAEVIQWYFFNTARSRKVVAELQGGEMLPVRFLKSEQEEDERASEVAVAAGTQVYHGPRSAVSEQGREASNARITGEHDGLSVTRDVPAMPAARGTQSAQKGQNAQNVQVQYERPNIFVLYEQNIGLLSPLIADQLRDAADHYPQEWIEAAFREAVQHNKRKWSYISAILRRWETEGRQAWNA